MRVGPLLQKAGQTPAVLAPQGGFGDAAHQPGEKTERPAQILERLAETPPRMPTVVAAHAAQDFGPQGRLAELAARYQDGPRRDSSAGLG